ncbi:MAG: TonB-dependent receptor [Flavobacteriales bacterium]|nr:TonB-dependent receptor [Flavobacteriales bacterium]
MGLFSILHFPFSSFSQTLKGSVHGHTDSGHSPLVGASIIWSGTAIGTVTDVDGNFSLSTSEGLPGVVVVSYVGFAPDTLTVTSTSRPLQVMLKPLMMEGVTVTAQIAGVEYRLMDPIVAEQIGSHELRKGACCNLSESFETNASVDVVLNDAVSGAKRIQMLGLDGTYVQIQAENVPLIRGLSSSYGMGLIPGTWVESIQIIKGPGSVVNGYESMAGQINIEYFKPNTAERLFINGYANTGGRLELNVQTAKQFTEKVGTQFYAHLSGIVAENDMNDDGFMDMPKYTQMNVFNRWTFQGKNTFGQVGIRAVYDDKVGGQLGFRSGMERTVELPYGIGITTRQVDLFSKTGFFVPNVDDMSIALITNWRYHDQMSFFGMKDYDGTQQSANFSLLTRKGWKDDRHELKAGLSFLYDHFDEVYNDSTFWRVERVPGAFAEYAFNIPEKFSVLAGFRADYHLMFGWLLTPRLHLRYNPTENTVLRLTGGRGYRMANVFAEHGAVLASSRTVMVLESLRPEESWNFGVSASHNFKVLGRPASAHASFYRTDFVNQVVLDLDADVRQVRFYNLDGRSFSNALQTELSYEPANRLELKLAYKFNDVQVTTAGLLQHKALTQRHTLLATVHYATRFDKWQFDLTVQGHGPRRLADTRANPEEYRLEENAPWYMTMNLQITKKFKWFEVYAGAENLTNFVQHDAIIASSEPHGPYFDASQVWGPTMGINPYLGFRYALK